MLRFSHDLIKLQNGLFCVYVVLKDCSLRNRLELGECAYSDHILLYRVFKGWLQAKLAHEEARFCERNRVDMAVMDRIDLKR